LAAVSTMSTPVSNHSQIQHQSCKRDVRSIDCGGGLGGESSYFGAVFPTVVLEGNDARPQASKEKSWQRHDQMPKRPHLCNLDIFLSAEFTKMLIGV
jgi:hypothetical protein